MFHFLIKYYIYPRVLINSIDVDLILTRTALSSFEFLTVFDERITVAIPRRASARSRLAIVCLSVSVRLCWLIERTQSCPSVPVLQRAQTVRARTHR